jgi:sugar lactone lactonase YvrE
MWPIALAVDAHSLYVSDGARQLVRRVDLSSGTSSVLVGGGGAQDVAVAPDGGVLLAARTLYEIGSDGLVRSISSELDKSWFGPLSVSSTGEIDATNVSYLRDSVFAVSEANRPVQLAGQSAYPGSSHFPISGSVADGAVATSVTLGDVAGLARASDGTLWISTQRAGAVDNDTFVVDSAGFIRQAPGPGLAQIRAGGSGEVFGVRATDLALVRESLTEPPVLVAGGGSGPVVEGAAAAGSGLRVTSVAYAPDGTVYVGDGTRVWHVDTLGGLHVVAGADTQDASGNSSYLGSSGDGGPATDAELLSPVELAADSSGQVFIGDQGLYAPAVRKVATDGTITTFAGGANAVGGDGGPAAAASISPPTALATAADGSVYLGTGGLLRKVDPAGTITTVAGGGSDASQDYVGPATGARLGVSAVAVGPNGTVYIADGVRGTIERLDAGILSRYAGVARDPYPVCYPSQADGPALEARLCGVAGLQVDEASTLYLTMPTGVGGRPGGSVATVSSAGEFHVVANGTGTGRAALGDLDLSPTAVARSTDGRLYVSGESACTSCPGFLLRRIDPDGTVTTLIGGPTPGDFDAGTGGPAAMAGLYPSGGLAIGPDGSLLFEESNLGRVRVIGSPGQQVVPPGAARDVRATPGNAQVTVSWLPPHVDGGSDISGYTVTASPGGQLVAVGGARTSAVVSNLQNGTAYTFTVTAQTVAGSGGRSAPTVPVQPAAPATPCPAPTRLRIARASGAAHLDWSVPIACGSGPNTAYRLVAEPGHHVADAYAGETAGVASGTVEGLTDGVRYSVTVSAVNAAGVGPASQALQVAPASAPTAPQNVRFLPRDGTSTVVWDAPAEDGGEPVRNYTLEAAGERVFPATVEELNVPTPNGQQLYVALSAGNSVGESARTPNLSPWSGAGISGTAPSSPTHVTATANPDRTVTVQWQAPTENGGNQLTDYVVVSQPQRRAVIVDGSAHSAVVSGLRGGANYSFVVYAGTAKAQGPGSAPSDTITTAPPVPPSVPAVAVTRPGNKALGVWWSAPKDDGGAALTGYTVSVGAQSQTMGPHTHSAVFRGLPNDRRITVSVRASNVAGVGAAATAWCVPRVPRDDFLGRGRSDTASYRPSNSTWYLGGAGTVTMGPGATPAAGDYDGDGRTEPVVFIRLSGWWVFAGKSSIAYGQRYDVPVPADYTGDGRTDIAVFRPSDRHWYIRGVANIGYGQAGDVPVPADYTGAGHANIAVFRPSTGQWLIRGMPAFTFGRNGDIPVAADYNGDGRADAAVFRPATGQWFIRGIAKVTYGRSGDIPVPDDYNGDSRAELSVFRPSTGVWYIRGTTPVETGGMPGDIPI